MAAGFYQVRGGKKLRRLRLNLAILKRLPKADINLVGVVYAGARCGGARYIQPNGRK